MNKAKLFHTIFVVAFLLGFVLVGSASAKASKVSMCHKRGNGTFIMINISAKALPAHLRHGDASVGQPVPGHPGDFFDASCKFVQPTRFSSPPLSFGPMGWGGWSCPADKPHAVGGGYTPSTAVVTSSYLAIPGAPLYPVFPHYTFKPGETGWVVQNSNTSQTLTIYVDCLP